MTGFCVILSQTAEESASEPEMTLTHWSQDQGGRKKTDERIGRAEILTAIQLDDPINGSRGCIERRVDLRVLFLHEKCNEMRINWEGMSEESDGRGKMMVRRTCGLSGPDRLRTRACNCRSGKHTVPIDKTSLACLSMATIGIRRKTASAIVRAASGASTTLMWKGRSRLNVRWPMHQRTVRMF